MNCRNFAQDDIDICPAQLRIFTNLKEENTVFKSLIAITPTNIIIFQDEYSSLGGNPCARKLKG